MNNLKPEPQDTSYGTTKRETGSKKVKKNNIKPEEFINRMQMKVIDDQIRVKMRQIRKLAQVMRSVGLRINTEHMLEPEFLYGDYMLQYVERSGLHDFVRVCASDGDWFGHGIPVTEFLWWRWISAVQLGYAFHKVSEAKASGKPTSSLENQYYHDPYE